MRKKKCITRGDINGLLFALPWLIGFLLLSVYPLSMSLYYSFTEFNPVTDPVWIGLENYISLFKDPRLYKANGLRLSWWKVPTVRW